VVSNVASSDVRTWRPQGFGRRDVRRISDPLIEPLWAGERVLAVAQRGYPLDLRDSEGEPLEGPAIEVIAAQLDEALLADTVVLDGYLTHQATTPAVMDVNRGIQLPSAQQMVTQMLFGRRGSAGAARRAAPSGDPGAPVAFVAVDLLAIDSEPLLEVPLLERKRLLESAVLETTLIRRTAYVRPPVDRWLVTWRSLGFQDLAYKAANSRYTPGARNDEWAAIAIPRN
jgi:hypothetical protein